jgi:hypothetical protein
MSVLMVITGGIGTILIIIWAIMVLKVVFKESVLIGVISLLFLLPGCLYQGIAHWPKLKKAWLLFGIGIVFYGFACLIDLAYFKGQGLSL